MSKIQILREEISNRIAAGEVIERPASVVKELVDNAIDAGATRILVNIVNGGSSLIQVSDNGSGMDQNDALMCLEAHATSKIRGIEDLEKIISFGFRGEAIPSIASVSRFTILTREHSAIEGHKVEVEGGQIKNISSTGCPPGTTISVKNLFYNVPARKKFLKSRHTEENHIQEIVLLLALSRLDLFLELKFNGRTVFSVPPSQDIRTRAALLFGRSHIKEMLPVNYSEAGITITGLTARPSMTRRSRKEQRSFVNGRPIENNSIYGGVKDAYFGLVEKGQFAPCLLYYIMDPALVDINVHPAKREVRFFDDRLLGNITAHAIKDALFPQQQAVAHTEDLETTETQVVKQEEEITTNFHFEDLPKPSLPKPNLGKMSSISHQIEPLSHPMGETSKPELDPPQNSQQARIEPQAEAQRPKETKAPVAVPLQRTNAQAPAAPRVLRAPHEQPSPNTAQSSKSFGDLVVLGLHQKRYIITSTTNGLVLVNVRAAQERILFEKILARKTEEHSQALLIPVHIELPLADVALLKRHIKEITDLGFEIEAFGGQTYIISAVPNHFPQENINGQMLDLLDQLRDAPQNIKRQKEQIIAQLVCRSAVRHYKELKDIEMKHLIDELSRCQMPYSCPQGKPTLINFANSELNKRFGR